MTIFNHDFSSGLYQSSSKWLASKSCRGIDRSSAVWQDDIGATGFSGEFATLFRLGGSGGGCGIRESYVQSCAVAWSGGHRRSAAVSANFSSAEGACGSEGKSGTVFDFGKCFTRNCPARPRSRWPVAWKSSKWGAFIWASLPKRSLTLCGYGAAFPDLFWQAPRWTVWSGGSNLFAHFWRGIWRSWDSVCRLKSWGDFGR